MMSVNKEEIAKKTTLGGNQNLPSVDRSLINLHKQLMNEIITGQWFYILLTNILYCSRRKQLLEVGDKLIGVYLKKPDKLPPRTQVVSNEICMILKRRVAFEPSSSSDESLCNGKTDDWNTYNQQ